MPSTNPRFAASHTSKPSAWYAIYTRHQHEKAVTQVLRAKGFETLLPLYSAAHRWKDRTKLVLLPLFPCYVFLRGALERRLDVLTTPGVHHVVSSQGHPAPIPESEIDAVRRTLEGAMGVEIHPFIRCGDWVRVEAGPLAGIEGILVRKKNRFRLVLSVELLQKSVSVEVDAAAVKRVSRHVPVRAPVRMIGDTLAPV